VWKDEEAFQNAKRSTAEGFKKIGFNPQQIMKALNVREPLIRACFVPLPIAPIYWATKPGVHPFTQSLRVPFKRQRISVFELAPPMTRTPPFTQDISADDVKGISMMDLSQWSVKP
jgi:short-subunit dehydrogenase involved in D-alanine esterification of teichoic acids